MRILALDLETTGLMDNEHARVTEVAYAVWDTEFKRIARSKSYLVNCCEDGAEVPLEITELTGITSAILKEHGYTPAFMVEDLMKKIQNCEVVMARFAEFDKFFVEKEFKLQGETVPERTWLCTMKDVEYPASVTGKHQGHVAADHGFVNPFPHWGIGDVLTMLRIHELGGYGWDEPVKMAQSPMKRLVAKVSFDDRNKAKKEGFQWEPDKKQWFKDMRELKLKRDNPVYDFACSVETI